ncbi:MAG: tetratricopeptide repeat protein [Phycisphaerae bacterium]
MATPALNSQSKSEGIKPDYREGLHWLCLSIKQDCASAEDDLAKLYLQGRGVSKNLGKAIYWYRKAAAQNDSTGQRHLGLLYLAGQGVPHSYHTAAHCTGLPWPQKAAAPSASTILASFTLMAMACLKT